MMKKRILTWLGLTAVILNGLAYQITIPSGVGMIANQLDNGMGNTADQLFPNPSGELDGCIIEKWKCCCCRTDFTFDSACPTGFGDANDVNCVPAPTLVPGEGAFFVNNSARGPITITFTGTSIVPVLPAPLPCGCGQSNLLSRQTADIGTYENITGRAPADGAQVARYNGTEWTTYTFSSCTWTPSEPILNIGESAFFWIPCVTNCCCVPPNMSAWWPFDESSGPVANDIAGTVNNLGTYQGSPTPVMGKVSNALCFNGTTDCVLVTNQEEINFIGSCSNGAESFTIDAWIRANAGEPTTQTLLDKRINPASPQGYSVFLYNGNLGIQIADGAGWQNYYGTAPDLRDGQWHFIAVTVARCTNDVNAGILYVDGNVVHTFTDPRTGDLNNPANLYIGCRNPAFGANYYSGCMDELEIYKRALTSLEIGTIFYAGPAGKCKTNCLESLVLACATNKTIWCPTNWSFDDPIVTDPCCGTNYTLTFTTVTNGTACSNSFTRTWHVVDCLNRTATCSQTVIVMNAMVVLCAGDKTVQCDTSWDFDPPTFPNACCSNLLASVVSTVVTNFGPCLKTYTRTWQVTNDCCTNFNFSCSQTVTASNITLLSVICSADKTVECGTDECGASWTFDPPRTTGGCGVGITVLGPDTTNGMCPWLITRRWQVTNVCDESCYLCTQTVTVVDTTPPIFFWSSQSANLVPNPGFESHSSCPSDQAQVDRAVPWFQPTFATSDYYHTCASSSFASVPDNFFGHQDPHSGQGYTGLYAYDAENYREYIEVPLTEPLMAGRTHQVSFYVNLADRSGFAVDNLGAYFSIGPVTDSTHGTPLPFVPQVRNPAGRFLSSQVEWMLVGGVFTAAGGENYLTIGNFYDDLNTPTIGSGFAAYYYVDDVTVRGIGPCPFNKTVNYGTAWTFDTPTVWDACCGTKVSLSSTTTTNYSRSLETYYTRTWTATDCCSNTATCSQTVTVLPFINLTPNVTPNGGGFILDWPPEGGWILQRANSVLGPWNDVPEATNSYWIVPTEPQQFYRLRSEP